MCPAAWTTVTRWQGWVTPPAEEARWVAFAVCLVFGERKHLPHLISPAQIVFQVTRKPCFPSMGLKMLQVSKKKKHITFFLMVPNFFRRQVCFVSLVGLSFRWPCQQGYQQRDDRGILEKNQTYLHEQAAVGWTLGELADLLSLCQLFLKNHREHVASGHRRFLSSLWLRCWSALWHPLPSKLRNSVYFPDTGVSLLWNNSEWLKIPWESSVFLSGGLHLSWLQNFESHTVRRANHPCSSHRAWGGAGISPSMTRLYVQWDEFLAGTTHLFHGA